MAYLAFCSGRTAAHRSSSCRCCQAMALSMTRQGTCQWALTVSSSELSSYLIFYLRRTNGFSAADARRYSNSPEGRKLWLSGQMRETLVSVESAPAFQRVIHLPKKTDYWMIQQKVFLVFKGPVLLWSPEAKYTESSNHVSQPRISLLAPERLFLNPHLCYSMWTQQTFPQIQVL